MGDDSRVDAGGNISSIRTLPGRGCADVHASVCLSAGQRPVSHWTLAERRGAAERRRRETLSSERRHFLSVQTTIPNWANVTDGEEPARRSPLPSSIIRNSARLLNTNSFPSLGLEPSAFPQTAAGLLLKLLFSRTH